MKCVSYKMMGLLFLCLAIQFWIIPSLLLANPTPTENSSLVTTGNEQSLGRSIESVMPDLFTGSMNYQVPIEVPPGRNGLQPLLALKYRSSNGNGWVGMGWVLEVGAIERSTRNGVDYTKDNYVYRRDSGISDLVSVGNGGFRSKIESEFTNIQKQSDGSFIAIDKVGTKYYFGHEQAANSKVTGFPGTFKWSLDRVEDTSNNFITYSYQNDGNGQIYLDHIDYNGNQIKFYLENRDDMPELYTAGFLIKTSKRIKWIHVFSADSSSTITRSYKLSYLNSNATGRSNLSTVQQYGKGATVDAYGNITNEGSLSKLPTQTFSINNQVNGFTDDKWADTATWNNGSYNGNKYINTVAIGDFNGDGRSDIISTRIDQVYMKESKRDQSGKNFFEDKKWETHWYHNGDFGLADIYQNVAWNGYFNDDTRMDVFNGGVVNVSKIDANGNEFFDNQPSVLVGTWGSTGYNWIGDFNGDGRTDSASAIGSTIYVRLSKQKSDGTYDFDEAPWPSTAANWGSPDFTWIGDFNGDGLADIATRVGNTIWIKINKNGSFEETAWATPANWGTKDNTWIGDFNGDGRTDIATRVGNTIWVYLSKVDATGKNIFEEQIWTTTATHWGDDVWIGDFNGDGLPDIATRIGSTMYVYLSKGNVSQHDFSGNQISELSGFEEQVFSTTLNWNNVGISRVGDFDGDGKSDIFTAHDVTVQTKYPVSGNIRVKQSNNFPVDKIVHIDNGIGGRIDIEYTPSTNYSNTSLPFPVQVVSAITRNGAEVTTIDYAGGYFYMPDKDFRGFNHVTVKGPVGPNLEQQITETWFHQGNDLDFVTNEPKVDTGFMKGKPYFVRVSDAGGNIYSETETTYAAENNTISPPPPWHFNPPKQVDTYTCDGSVQIPAKCKYSSTAKHISTNYLYDSDTTGTEYGNLSYEYRHGDMSTTDDDLTIHRIYTSNESSWIVGLPTSEKIYQGSDTTTKIAETNYFYDDDTTNWCPLSTNQGPNKGLLTRIDRWLHYAGDPTSTVTDPDSTVEERMAYDSHGNLVCRQDARTNTTSITYDITNTFPVTVTTPPPDNFHLGLVYTSKYYGVNADAGGQGLYGQMQSVTDPNVAKTLYEYDSLGRQSKLTMPDTTWTSWAYNNFGTVSTQHIRTETSDGLWAESYFDGFGRTYLNKSKGPESKIIVTDTFYNNRGAVSNTSFPYFYGTKDTPSYVMTNYDAIGRVRQTGQGSPADYIRILTCYNNDATVIIDPNNHRRRQVRDAFGRLTKVQEYLGTFSSCTTGEDTVNATTTYQYDVLGNLLLVTDAMTPPNQTEIRYDSLGRKRYMRDPDMGAWTYRYDGSGNLITQTDANGQVINFAYDNLNRLTTKSYGASIVVTNYYDDEVPGYFNKGQLTKMADNSGQTTYKYDIMGNVTSTTKTINGASTPYTLEFTFPNGRLGSITYPAPDNEIVNYTYDAGYLKGITGYISYSNFDALGRPANAAYGTGGASSLYSYDADTKRLSSITVASPPPPAPAVPPPPLIDNIYGYDNKGNITSITDNLNKERPTTSVTNEIYTPVRAHALGSTVSGRQFQYDNNGNMCNDSGTSCINGQAPIIYNFDNMPTAIRNVSFVYDGNGTRVNKTGPGFSTDYIGKLFECPRNSGTSSCTKYIFAGNERVAVNSGGTLLFYHPDHQGGTSVVTDANGILAEDISYEPFGRKRSDVGPGPVRTIVKHRYTGQELDETGLYNYGARLYDPDLGRFMTPDSIVPDPENPQSFNRYAYARNNPINRVDPSGNLDFDFNGISFCLFDCGGGGGGISGSGSSGGGFTASANVSFSFNSTSNNNYNTDSSNTSADTENFDGKGGDDVNSRSPYGEIRMPPSNAQRVVDYFNTDLHNFVNPANPNDSVNVFMKYLPIPSAAGAKLSITVAKQPGVYVGIYEFIAASGLRYVGQSENIPARILQHIASGKLLERNLSTLRTTEVLLNKTGREIAEQLRINELGGIIKNGVKNLENIRNPIGPARSYLLTK
jgi:RHS repeat-associated protein